MADDKLSAGRMRCLQALAFAKLKLTALEKGRIITGLVPGKISFHELTNAEADMVIDDLKRRAGQTPTRLQPRDRRRVRSAIATGDVATLITPAQRDRLAELMRELIAAGLSSNYLAGVRLRSCGRPDPATSQEGEKAIEALKALNDRVAAGWRPQQEPA